MFVLTVAAHANGEALFEPAELAAVPIQPDHKTLTVTKATVFNLLLDASSKEPLQINIQLYPITKMVLVFL